MDQELGDKHDKGNKKRRGPGLQALPRLALEWTPRRGVRRHGDLMRMRCYYDRYLPVDEGPVSFKLTTAASSPSPPPQACARAV